MVNKDAGFMFEWQEQYVTSERSKRVSLSCSRNLYFITFPDSSVFFSFTLAVKYTFDLTHAERKRNGRKATMTKANFQPEMKASNRQPMLVTIIEATIPIRVPNA